MGFKLIAYTSANKEQKTGQKIPKLPNKYLWFDSIIAVRLNQQASPPNIKFFFLIKLPFASVI